MVNSCDKNADEFLISCNTILDQYAPRKKKYVRVSHSLFMNKNLPKAIILRTKLRNIILKSRTQECKGRYIKQRNLCVSPLRKSKREYFNNLIKKNVCHIKKFWKVSGMKK